MFYFKMPNKLFCLEFTLPLCKMFLESSTGGVFNSNVSSAIVISPDCHTKLPAKYSNH